MWRALFTFVLGGSLLIAVSCGLSIQPPKKPYAVEIGSESGVVLDCPFEFASLDESKGLEVKWYFDGRPYPVYQWIPGHLPQALGLLKDRLDLSYQASDNHLSRHRALALINPTPDLAGNYTCWVSSYFVEDRISVLLVVYSPGTEMSIYYSKPSTELVQVSCFISGIYPEPDITLCREAGAVDICYDGAVEVLESPEPDGTVTFNVSIETNFYESDLHETNLFTCNASIPNTDYVVKEQILYIPERTTTEVPVTQTEEPHEAVDEKDTSVEDVLNKSTSLQSMTTSSETSAAHGSAFTCAGHVVYILTFFSTSAFLS